MKYVDSGAEFSDCGRYRYKLWRTRDRDLARLVIIMLNPSTADGRNDDPTLRSCVRLAAALGYGGVVILNLFAWRATDPADLPVDLLRARGPYNRRAVRAELRRRGVVVCAWGAGTAAARGSPSMMSEVARHRRRVYCFGLTKAGCPRHPLYVRSDKELEIYWEVE